MSSFLQRLLEVRVLRNSTVPTQLRFDATGGERRWVLHICVYSNCPAGELRIDSRRGESAFDLHHCVTKPALGSGAYGSYAKLGSLATTECPSSMTFICCLFEGDAGLRLRNRYLRAVMISLHYSSMSSASD